MPSSFRRYAVDGGNDGHRDLYADWDDVFASVANYFKAHGWGAGPGARRRVQPDAPVAAVPEPGAQRNPRGPQAKGGDFDTGVQRENTPVLLVPAESELGPSYRVGFENFDVITRYNRSVRYAMAVHDLRRRSRGASRRRPPAAPGETKLAAQSDSATVSALIASAPCHKFRIFPQETCIPGGLHG